MPRNPGFHTIRVGDITVTALNDGTFEGSLGMMAGIAPEAAEATLRQAGRRVPQIMTVNSFLIRAGDHVALVDTGMGTLMGPALGHLPEWLAAIDVAPGSIDTVLMTHLHIDHVGGLTDASGAAAFPNATLVMHEAEAGFWLDEAIAAQAPEAARNSFALAASTTAPYAGRTRLVADGEVLPGVAIMKLPGHTPGHSGFLITSGGASLLIWGDVVHVPPIQFAQPEVGLVFDTDIAEAKATRARVLEMAAAEKIMVAGMHLEFPAFGTVVRAGTGYAFVPTLWLPE